MKWYRREDPQGIRIYLVLNKEMVKLLIEQLQAITGDAPEMSILLTPENELNNLKVNVTDATQPTEVLTKTKPWFNGPHTFPTVKIETPPQLKSLGINVSDGLKVGEHIG